MKKFIAFICLFVVLGPLLRAGLYVQPSVNYLFLGDGYKDEVGLGLSAGYNFDKDHSLGVEVTRFKAETHGRKPFTDWNSQRTIIPVLASYRFSLPVEKSFAFFAGPSIGIMVETYEYSEAYQFWYLIPPIYTSSRETVRPLCYGGEIGLTGRLTKSISVSLAAKAFRANSANSHPSATYCMLQFAGRYEF